MSQWDRSKKDGIVTLAEFEDYYTDLSASLDTQLQTQMANSELLWLKEVKPSPMMIVLKSSTVLRFDDEETKRY